MKLTPFVLVLGPLNIFLFFGSLYSLFIDGLGTVLGLIGLLIFLSVLGIEQTIIGQLTVQKKYIWIFESILLLLLVSVFYIFLR